MRITSKNMAGEHLDPGFRRSFSFCLAGGAVILERNHVVGRQASAWYECQELPLLLEQ